MSCGKDAEHCKQIAAGQGAPEAMAVWAEGRGAGGHCPDCGGFLTTEGVCNNPHTFSMSLAGGSILGMVDTTDIMGVCPDCGAELSVAPGEEDWCMQCEELVRASESNYAVEAEIKQLRSSDRSQLAKAMNSLVHSTNPNRVSMLINALLGERDSNTRWAMVHLLGKIGDTVAVPALIKCATDRGKDVRMEAARVLGEMGNKSASAILGNRLTHDRSPDVRYYAAEALAKLEDPSSIPDLIAGLGNPKGILITAGDALVKIGIRAIPALKKALKENTDAELRGSVAWVLGRIGDPAAIPALEKALEDLFPDVRREAAEALGAIGDPTAIPALEKALGDTDHYVYEAAQESINKIKA